MTQLASAALEKISKQEADTPSAKDFVFFLTHLIQTDHKLLYCILLYQSNSFLLSHWRNVSAYDKMISSDHLRLEVIGNESCSEICHSHNNNIWKHLSMYYISMYYSIWKGKRKLFGEHCPVDCRKHTSLSQENFWSDSPRPTQVYTRIVMFYTMSDLSCWLIKQ